MQPLKINLYVDFCPSESLSPDDKNFTPNSIFVSTCVNFRRCSPEIESQVKSIKVQGERRKLARLAKLNELTKIPETGFWCYSLLTTEQEARCNAYLSNSGQHLTPRQIAEALNVKEKKVASIFITLKHALMPVAGFLVSHKLHAPELGRQLKFISVILDSPAVGIKDGDSILKELWRNYFNETKRIWRRKFNAEVTFSFCDEKQDPPGLIYADALANVMAGTLKLVQFINQEVEARPDLPRYTNGGKETIVKILEDMSKRKVLCIATSSEMAELVKIVRGDYRLKNSSSMVVFNNFFGYLTN